MVTVDRRSDGAAALCYAALTPPGARTAHVGEAGGWGGTRPSPLRKKNKSEILHWPHSEQRIQTTSPPPVSHLTVAWETGPKLETLNL